MNNSMIISIIVSIIAVVALGLIVWHLWFRYPEGHGKTSEAADKEIKEAESAMNTTITSLKAKSDKNKAV